jgi:ribosome maturation factor RimP
MKSAGFGRKGMAGFGRRDVAGFGRKGTAGFGRASRRGGRMTGTDNPVVDRVRRLATPIVADLGLDLYDVEQRGGTLRVTIDTRPGSTGGVDLDTLALATRLLSRDLDHEDPVPGHYTLEVTSPGVERTLRTPAHFQREIGKTVNVRLSEVVNDLRRVEGVLVAAGETAATVQVVTDADPTRIETVEIPYARIDRARTVFVWGPAPKPGRPKPGAKKGAARTAAPGAGATASDDPAADEHLAEDKETSS